MGMGSGDGRWEGEGERNACKSIGWFETRDSFGILPRCTVVFKLMPWNVIQDSVMKSSHQGSPGFRILPGFFQDSESVVWRRGSTGFFGFIFRDSWGFLGILGDSYRIFYCSIDCNQQNDAGMKIGSKNLKESSKNIQKCPKILKESPEMSKNLQRITKNPQKFFKNPLRILKNPSESSPPPKRESQKFSWNPRASQRIPKNPRSNEPDPINWKHKRDSQQILGRFSADSRLWPSDQTNSTPKEASSGWGWHLAEADSNDQSNDSIGSQHSHTPVPLDAGFNH